MAPPAKPKSQKTDRSPINTRAFAKGADNLQDSEIIVMQGQSAIQTLTSSVSTSENNVPIEPTSETPIDPILQQSTESVSREVLEARARRKRRLELEKEAVSAKLRLIEIEREQLELEDLNASENLEIHVNSPVATPPITIPSLPQANSTTINENDEFVSRMTRALTDALNGSRLNESNPGLLNRLATHANKGNLTFSGNPLEYLRFKRAFQQSTVLGNYSDLENVSRLYDCLKGEAKEAVEGLMYSTESANEIMKSLDLLYGRKDIILLKLVEILRNLPRLNTGEVGLISFAGSVKNCVVAMNYVGDSGYIKNPELICDILRKLPEPTLYRYNEYISKKNRDSDLTALSDFLSEDAEKANKAGTAGILECRLKNQDSSRNASRRGKTFAIVEKPPTGHADKKIDSACLCCKKGSHFLHSCRKFISFSISDRWNFVKEQKVCFKCLKGNHLQRNCEFSNCDESGCNRPHNKLLHFTIRENALTAHNVSRSQENPL